MPRDKSPDSTLALHEHPECREKLRAGEDG